MCKRPHPYIHRPHRPTRQSNDKRTVAGRAVAGRPRQESDACASKQDENCTQWASDSLGETVRSVDAYRRRVGGERSEIPMSAADGGLDDDHWIDAYAQAETAVRFSSGEGWVRDGWWAYYKSK